MTVYSESETISDIEIYCSIGNETVSVLTLNKANYLFLPAEAPSDAIRLNSNKEHYDVKFKIDGIYHDSIDLNDFEINKDKYSAIIEVINESGENVYGPIPLNIMHGKNIGTVYYHSDDPNNAGRQFIDTSKENRGSGIARVIDDSGNLMYEGVIDDIHARGNSSFRFPKKSYQIKLKKKTSLINGAGKAKKWILLAEYLDELKSNDKLLKDIARNTALQNGRFSPKEEPVNFYYDGEYRGVYLLSEKNEINSTRININDMENDYEKNDLSYGETESIKSANNKYGKIYYYQDGLKSSEKQGGYLLEINSGTGDELNWFKFSDGNGNWAVNIKSPELGSKQEVSYISEYFQEFCDALSITEDTSDQGRNRNTGLYYYDYCDIDSLVDAYLQQELSGNLDAFRRSQYFYKDDENKMFAGPLWDMDRTFRSGHAGENLTVGNKKALVGNLIKHPSFRYLLKKRYDEFYAPTLEVLAGISQGSSSLRGYAEKIQENIAMDWILWYLGSQTYDQLIEERIKWITDHKKALDAYYSSMGIDEKEVHIYEDALPVTDSTHTRTCKMHPEETHTEKCIYRSEVTLAPTDETDGIRTYTCYSCGNTKTEVISAETVIDSDIGQEQSIDGYFSGGSGGAAAPNSNEDPAAKVDRSAADTFNEAVASIPEDISLEDESTIVAARSSYDTLTETQKALLDPATIDRLFEAEQAISVLKEYQGNVISAKNLKIKRFKVKALKRKKAVVSWESGEANVLYEIQYSRKKSFKKANTKMIRTSFTNKMTVKNLKRGTYYFRVRPLTLVENKRTGETVSIKGVWSPIKRIKMKK